MTLPAPGRALAAVRAPLSPPHNRVVRTLLFDEVALPSALRAQVEELRREAWPELGVSEALARRFHDPALDPMMMVLVDGERVLAALAMLHTRLRHAGEPFSVAGLSSVVTRARARGRGYGRRLVAAAHDRMASSHLDLGLFTCDRPLRGFYQRAGWHPLPGSVLVGGTAAAPFRSDEEGLDKVTMADFFSARAAARRQTFEHAEIELYPGEIDRLW